VDHMDPKPQFPNPETQTPKPKPRNPNPETQTSKTLDPKP